MLSMIDRGKYIFLYQYPHICRCCEQNLIKLFIIIYHLLTYQWARISTMIASPSIAMSIITYRK